MPLREYVEARLGFQEKEIDRHKAEIDHLRAVLADGIPRREHDLLAERIGRIEQKQANIDGRLWVIAVGIPLAVTIISLFIDKFFR